MKAIYFVALWLLFSWANAESSWAQTTVKIAAKEMTTAVAEAERVGQAFSEVAERVSPAVVSLRVEARQKATGFPFRFFGRGPDEPEQDMGIARGNGSGVIIRASGEILTNHHVVKDATRIEVLLRDGRRFDGTVIGVDEATDLAIVRIKASGLPALSFADSKSVRVGQWVLAVGSPYGLDYSVTTGVVSAIGRGGIGANEIEDYLQTDASINPGNSGGPLVNLRGDIVGINTMIVGRGTGIGFAVPASLARNVVEQVLQSGTVRRAWIGVSFQELTPELGKQFGLADGKGALVSTALADGPAAKAGIKPGDVIIGVDGDPIGASADLLRYVLGKRVGQKITLAVVRDGKKREVTVVTTQRPKQGGEAAAASREDSADKQRSPASDRGLQVRDLTPELAQRLGIKGRAGVVVASVDPGSPAERAGLRRGDRIVEADRKALQKVADLNAALAKGSALLRVERDDGAFYVVLGK